MARIAIDQMVVGASTTPIISYDSTKWSLGSLIDTNDNYIGPFKIAQARPTDEVNGTFQAVMMDGFQWSTRYDWVFLLENIATAVTARRIDAYTYDRILQTYNFKGFISHQLNAVGAATTNRGFKMCYYTYYGGTVSTSGISTTLTGAGTSFSTARIGAGARIGFGVTDSTLVSSWSYISSITNDNTLVLVSPTTVTSGPYVIEELRSVITTTSTTGTTNSGVFISKGVNFDDFTSGGTIIGTASTTDNFKATYWLADGITVSNITSAGAAIDNNYQPNFTGNTHSLYVIDSTQATTPRVFVYNIRANDTISGGAGRMTLTGSNIIFSGTQSITGTLAAINNGVVRTAGHGPGLGVKSLYFLTTTRLYRAATSNIVAGNITWQSDARTEVPPGSVNTMLASSLLSIVDYDVLSDKFLFFTTGAGGVRSYYSRFPNNNGDALDFTFLNEYKLLDAVASVSTAIPYNTSSLAVYSSFINGVAHLYRQGSAATTGLSGLFAVPIAAHWNTPGLSVSNTQYVVSPIISTPNNNKFVRLITNFIDSIGTDPYIVTPNAIRSSYRTSGMSDNSGAWTALSSTGDLSSVAGTSQIQFLFEFQMVGHCTGIPGRLTGFTLVYDDLSNDTHYQPSVTWSSATNKQFAWRFATAFGATVSTLRVRLYNAVSNGLLVDDVSATASSTGIWEESTNDGVSFATWSNADKTNDTTYLRYTPASLADNIKVRALLTLN